ncbi:hypothetical protein DF3PB_10088 [uncultured Defluviicoccus sp.]|uniref:Uncharacterized protein n=1 Tax=metagenome TaxID=256318 RepID=A0A380T7G9_9ZZZZ|nr:hypothetical protein DF3PB_10088 [uncultured Defluviicoccus sp.]
MSLHKTQRDVQCIGQALSLGDFIRERSEAETHLPALPISKPDDSSAAERAAAKSEGSKP